MLRLFGSARHRLRVEIEAAIHNAAHAAGLPVPEVFANSADGLIGGLPFMVMARARGIPMVDAPSDVPKLR